MSFSTHRTGERRILHLLHSHRGAAFHLPHLTSIHARILRLNLHCSNLLLSHLVSVCASLGHASYAHRVFLHSRHPNLLLFNSVIKAHSLSPPTSQQSLNTFSQMRARGIYPDRFTFVPLLKACANLVDVAAGRGLHAEVIVAGVEFHQSVQIGLVELYSTCGQMEDARKVFDLMPEKYVIVWNLMIQGFCCRGGDDLDCAYRMFREMSERNVVTWNTMIGGLARGGRDEEALGLFREMWDVEVEPDDATLVTVLPVCAHVGALDVGRWIHSYADREGFSKDVVNVGNSLIDMYCKCGDLKSAGSVFQNMARKNVVSWNAIIVGLAFNGEGEAGVNMFEEMKRHGVLPNAVTYIGALGCCTHAGLVQRGWEFFESMVNEHGIEARLEHYGCMVDLLGRAGHVKEAFDLIRGMPMKPSAAIWGALLNASRIHTNLDIVEHATKELIDIEPGNSGNYVLLSNIYSEAGRWVDVEKVRLMMKENNVLKSPGHSLVETK